MNIFKSKVEKLISKISKENLKLLDPVDRNSEYELQRLYDWQEDYSDDTEWEEFKDYCYCERCNYYDEGQCICYTGK